MRTATEPVVAAAAPAEPPAAAASAEAPAAEPPRPEAPAAATPAAPAASEEPPAVPDDTEQAPTGGLTLVDVRRLWPDIVEATKARRRVTWMHLTQHAQVVGVDATTLTLGFTAAGPRDNFAGGGHADIVREAAVATVGVEWRIEAIIDPGAGAGGGASGATGSAPRTAGGAPAPEQAPASPAAPTTPTPDSGPGPAEQHAGGPELSSRPEHGPAQPADGGQGAQGAARAAYSGGGISHAREAIQQTRPAGAAPDRGQDRSAADADAHPDDMDAETNGLAGAELLQRELGARVIEEIPHQ